MIKKIIVAFDSFKGCISAKDACDAAMEGICIQKMLVTPFKDFCLECLKLFLILFLAYK